MSAAILLLQFNQSKPAPKTTLHPEQSLYGLHTVELHRCLTRLWPACRSCSLWPTSENGSQAVFSGRIHKLPETERPQMTKQAAASWDCNRQTRLLGSVISSLQTAQVADHCRVECELPVALA